MAKEKLRHIVVSQARFADFEKLARAYDLSNKELLETMIHFFKVTQMDPRDVKPTSAADAIKALDRRLVSFIRQQEKEQLRPMKDELALITKKLYAFDDEESGVGKVSHLRKMNERLKQIAQKLGIT